MAMPGLHGILAGAFLKEEPTEFIDFGDTTLTFSGAPFIRRVPAGMTGLFLKMRGGGGGGGSFAGTRRAGNGGYMRLLMPVEENDIIEFQVGQGGNAPSGSNGGAAAYPDGGFGGASSSSSGDGPSGGGSTRVYKNGVLFAVIGGGGGGGMSTLGGGVAVGAFAGGFGKREHGGIFSVTDGFAGVGFGFSTDFAGGYGRSGGRTSAGTNDADSARDASGQNGGKGSSQANNTTNTADAGAGGGGGYFGGAGSFDQYGAGAGSAFVHEDAIWFSMLPNFQSVENGNLVWGSLDADYGGSAALGGQSNATDGGDGRIHFYAFSDMEARMIQAHYRPEQVTSDTNANTVGTVRLVRCYAHTDLIISEISTDIDGANGSPTLNVGVWSDWANAPYRQLGRGAGVTGVSDNVNTVSLTSPVSIPQGEYYWLGYVVGTAAAGRHLGNDPGDPAFMYASAAQAYDRMNCDTLAHGFSTATHQTVQYSVWAEAEETSGLMPFDKEVPVGLCANPNGSTQTIASGAGYGGFYVVPQDMEITHIVFRPAETDASTRYRGVIRSTTGTTTQAPDTVLAETGIGTGVTLGDEVRIALNTPLSVNEGDSIWVCLEVETSTLTLFGNTSLGKNGTWSSVDIDVPATNAPTTTASTTMRAVWAVGTPDDPDDFAVGSFARFGTNIAMTTADVKRVQRVWVDRPCSISSIWAGFVQVDNGSAKVRAVIYDEVDTGAGAPGALLATGSEVTGLNGGKFLELPISYSFPSKGWYYIGLHSDTTLNMAFGSNLGTVYTNADTYADGPADPFGTPTVTTGIQLPLHMVCTPT